MSSEILVMGASGSFELTEHGEFTAYANAFDRLVAALLKRFKSIGDNQRAARRKKAKEYIQQNVKSVDDFLDHLDGIARAMGLKTEHLSQFAGNHLVTLVEKARDELRIAELERIRILKDPNHTISEEVIAEVGAVVQPGEVVFLKDGTQPDTPTTSPAEAGEVEVKPVIPISTVSPNEDLLTAVGGQFAKLGVIPPPIVLGKGHDNSHLPHDVALKVAEQLDTSDGDETDDERPALPVVARSGQLPTEELMETLGGDPILNGQSLLDIFDSLQAQKDGSNNPAPGPVQAEVSADQIEAELERAKQGSLLDFATYYKIIQELTRFQKSGDKAGYQAWVQNSGELQKAVLNLRNNMAAESKGNSVDWAKIQNELAHKLGKGPSDIAGLKADIRMYDQARQQLGRLQKRVIDYCAKSSIDVRPHFKTIAPDLIHLFEKKDNISTKKRTLKMSLLKIGKPGVAKIIEQAAHQELTLLAKLYGLN